MPSGRREAGPITTFASTAKRHSSSGDRAPGRTQPCPTMATGAKLMNRAGEPFRRAVAERGLGRGGGGLVAHKRVYLDAAQFGHHAAVLAKNAASATARFCEASRPTSTQRTIPAAGPG